ncbi:MAG: hypothetical protein ACR2OY_09580 [Boseongicola sp.]
MSMRILISSTAFIALAACSGGAGGGLGGGNATYAVLAADYLNFDLNRALGVSPSLPGAGSASYGGSMVVAEDLYGGNGVYINGDVLIDDADYAASGYIGEASLTADFTGGGTATVSGTVTNFYDTSIDTVTGALTGTTGGVPGTVTLSNGAYPGGGDPTMDVTGSIDGQAAGGSMIFEFFGPSGSAILGESLATGGMTLGGVNTDARLTSR